MHDFHFKKGELYCEDARVSDVAKSVGTPFYLYSYKTLVDHFTKIKTAFAPVNPIICFAMKANDSLSVIKALVDQGAGLDIVSLGELKKAKMVKANPQKIVFASVGKTREEIEAALSTGILFFNVESLPELERINAIAKAMWKAASVALRINPDVAAPTHDFITTGTLKKKFGIDLKTTRQIFQSRKKYPHVHINGL